MDMPTPTKGPRMGGSPAHERLMLANLATSLFEHGRITTTESKAKRLRPYAEHLVTFAKRGDLHARRQVLKRLNDKSVVHTLFAEIGPRYANRPGGYTRIVKLGPRKGDNAPMALIELVEPLTVAQQAVGEAERSRGTRFAAPRPVTGATRESAEALAGESGTAAAVAAAATPVDDAPLVPEDALAEESAPDAGTAATQESAAEPGAPEHVVTSPEAAVDEAAGSEPDGAGEDASSQAPPEKDAE